MKYTYIFAFYFAIVVFLWPSLLRAQLPADTVAFAAARDEGYRFVDLNKYPEAVAAYRKGLPHCDTTLWGRKSRALLYSNMAASYQRMFQFDSAVYYARSSVQIWVKQLSDTVSLGAAQAYRRLGSVYTDGRQPDSAIVYLKKSLAIVEARAAGEPAKQSDILVAIANAYLLGKSDYEHALEWFHRGLDMWESQKTAPTIEIFKFVYSIGTVHRASSNYIEARKWQQRALPLAQSMKDTLRMSNCIRETAWIDYGESKLEQAEEGFKTVLRLREIVYGPNNKLLADCYGDIGATLNEQNHFGEAIPYYEKAIQLGEKNYQPNHPRLAILYGNYAACLGRNGMYEQALIYSEKQLNIYRKNGRNKKEIADGCAFIAEIYASLEQQQQASAHYEEALTLYTEISATPNRERVLPVLAGIMRLNTLAGDYAANYRLLDTYHIMFEEQESGTQRELAYLLGKLGESALADGNVVMADTVFEKAFRLLGVDVRASALDLTADFNPQLQGVIGSKLRGLEIRLDAGEQQFRPELERYSRWALQLLDRRYLESSSKATREGLLRSNYRYYATAVRLAIDNSKPDQALALSEMAKARTLASRWAPAQTVLPTGFPANWLDMEADLQSRIAGIQEMLYQGKTSNADSLRNILLKYKLDLQKGQERIQRKFPQYHQQRYGMNPPTLKMIREDLLDDKTMLVTYTVCGDRLSIIALNRKESYLHTAHLGTSLAGQVAGFLAQIQSENDPFAAESLDALGIVATSLYELLLAEPLTRLGAGIERIILLPDDALGQLPFAALTDALPGTPYLHTWSWIGRKYTLQYGASAAVLLQQQASDKKMRLYEGSFAGFAPSYPDVDSLTESRFRQVRVRGGKYDLPFARKEVAELARLTKGKAWIGTAAGEPQFRQWAGMYRVLHCAMHGVVNAKQPEFSKLLFYTPESAVALSPEENGDFNAGDLPTLRLQAELAVLSACHTASGKTVQGEGVFSLAYGFMSAGVPAVVATHWTIDDQISMSFMLDFYRQLLAGASKDRALQQAANAMIARGVEQPELAHPYYWASYLFSGNRGALRW